MIGGTIPAQTHAAMNPTSMFRHSWVAAVIIAFATTSTAAQQPPEQSPAPQTPPVQTTAAAVLPPPPPPQDDDGSFVDKAKRWAEEHQIIERISGEVDGWYPRLGGMTRGGGFALGPGYRLRLGTVLVDGSFAYSTKAYMAVDVKTRWLQAFDERFELWTNYRYEDFPQEDFFGRGPDSSEDARVSYDFDSVDFHALALVKPLPWLQLGTNIGYMSPDIGSGTDPDYPAIDELFSDFDAPGLLEQPDYLHTTIFADVDYLDEKGRPRSGGFYRVALGLWDDRTLGRFDFKRFDGNFSQYVPIDSDKRHVLLGRLGFSYANNKAGGRVPFYFLPYVGGVDTVRSFHEFRFKDENAVWLTAEYNLTLIKWVSVATFVDAGKVAEDWQDIRPSDLKTGYGVGARVHTNRLTFARVDFATGGGEGWKMFLKLVPSF
jgi:hypothetical protein